MRSHRISIASAWVILLSNILQDVCNEVITAENHDAASATSKETSTSDVRVTEENTTLNSGFCRSYLLRIDAHGGGFWDPNSLDRYHRCLWVLRHTKEAQLPKEVAVGGQHYPTIILTNHRHPDMKMPPAKKPRGTHLRYSQVPLQTFQETQEAFSRAELQVPHHFVVPFFDVNIGNIIKNQGSMNHYQSYEMQSLLRPGDTVIDAGANLGCYTVPLAEAVGHNGRVIAFEPFRTMHQLLTANVALNGLQNVWTVRAALSRSSEVRNLLPPQLRSFSSPGGVKADGQSDHVNSLKQHEAFQLYDLLAQEHERVRFVRLDDLLLSAEEGDRWGLPSPFGDVRLIKIDVEGMEVAVAHGAATVIRSFRPIIWSENNAYFETNGKDTAFLQVMANLGYSCSKVSSAPTDLLCVDASGGGHQP